MEGDSRRTRRRTRRKTRRRNKRRTKRRPWEEIKEEEGLSSTKSSIPPTCLPYSS
jgi:hypothetical protein